MNFKAKKIIIIDYKIVNNKTILFSNIKILF